MYLCSPQLECGCCICTHVSVFPICRMWVNTVCVHIYLFTTPEMWVLYMHTFTRLSNGYNVTVVYVHTHSCFQATRLCDCCICKHLLLFPNSYIMWLLGVYTCTHYLSTIRFSDCCMCTRELMFPPGRLCDLCHVVDTDCVSKTQRCSHVPQRQRHACS